jgi:peroxiredoxin
MAASLSFAILAGFVYTVFVLARDLPLSANAPKVGERVPDFVLPDEAGRTVGLADLIHDGALGVNGRGVKGVLLVFSMYAGCRACNSEYRGIQEHLEELRNAGVRPVVISVDTPEVSRRLSEEAGYAFTFLSDPALEVIRRYDVAHGDMARPAEFLVDRDGIVRWRNLTGSVFVRARPAQILQAAAALP